MREIQRFPNLGHKIMRKWWANFTLLYLLNYEIYPFILGIFITDGSLQVSKKLKRLVNARDFEQCKHVEIINTFSYLLTFVSV